jgi:hypothetical protein
MHDLEMMAEEVELASVCDHQPPLERNVLERGDDVHPERLVEERHLELVGDAEPLRAARGEQDQEDVFSGDH